MSRATTRTPAERPLGEYPEVMSAQEVADYLGIDRQTFYRRRALGLLKLDPLPTGGRMLFSRYQVGQLVGVDPT